MATDAERRFHETWLGECQPEGLTFSVPVLADSGLFNRLSATQARALDHHLVDHRVTDLRALLLDFCGWRDDELHGPGTLPDDLVLRIAEEGTELRPTFAIPYGNPTDDPTGDPTQPPRPTLAAGEQTPATRAGQPYQMLVWELPPGLDLDEPESQTSAWHYPPAAKLERLLRETRVPMGLLANGDVVRLYACPPGGATGSITFPVAHMATPDGRDMLSALRELLHADRVMGGTPDIPTTLQLLELSRERQADVTNKLGEQALEALQILLEGFEAAARRDGDEPLRAAMRQDGNHVYEGLLTVVLRLIFALYAEDRKLLPIEHDAYRDHLSVTGLHDVLVEDADRYGDTMDQRFGAWPRLVMLFRALYFGLEHGQLSMPPHRGKLFNPERYAFLEGRLPVGGAPVSPEDRAATRLPSIADAVVFRVLRRLLVLDGQRLSYAALEEEQLGSVYEGLMGYAIERRMEPSICLAPSRVWVGPRDLLDQPRATRVRWLKDAGVDSAPAKRLAKAIEELEDTPAPGDTEPDLHLRVLATLRDFAITPKGKRARAREQLATDVPPDRLVIQPGEERRRTSSHYTPRSLSGPIVQRTLEPLLAAIRARIAREQPDLEDPQPTAEDLLSLKVCDPAMGSGAFLVETCRYLATHLVAAWVREGTLEQQLAAAGDEAVRRKPEQLALRMVAQRCLLGVDKNPLAVELGKLSLWLLTLARGQTFTFLDHCLKAGDSLVGLSRAQILALDWDPALGPGGAVAGSGGTDKAGKQKAGKKKASKKKAGKKKASRKAGGDAQIELFAEQTRRAYDKATLLRQRLADLAQRSDRDDIERQQHELHVEAERALEKLRDVADVVLSTYFFPFDDGEGLTPEFLFSETRVTDKHRRECLARVRDELNFWLMSGADQPLRRALELRRELVRECIRPMHWEIEFPEVFTDQRADPLMEGEVGAVWADAVVGNPPFLGGSGVSGAFGRPYLEWLLAQFTPSHGNSDLSAYFFRRASWMVGEHGTLGLIATNTIGQGDTRTTGLEPLVAGGAKIYDATRGMKWPVKGANVSVSVVHLAHGCAQQGLGCRLDGAEATAISTQLRAGAERSNPTRLAANQAKSYLGSKVYGNGFVLSPTARDEIIHKDSRNSERIFAYLGGQELNSTPKHEHDRYVLDFGDMSLEEAGRWPDLLGIVREKVKPQRDKLRDDTGPGRHGKKYWWQFQHRRTPLYAAIASLDRCLACSQVSKHSVFAFQPTDRVFSHTLVIFALPEYAHFGLLQSRIHERWARLHGSSMRNDLRYTPSDCFETFPFPDEPTLAADGPLEAIAKQLYETRAKHMVDTDQGLTKTYNALTDPDNQDPAIQPLRHLHEQLDRAVLDAYGHPNIPVPPFAGATDDQLEQFEDAVLDFLFERNAMLAARERAG